MMNHHLPAVPHVLPAIPHRSGRRPNDHHYTPPPHPGPMSQPPPNPHHYSHPHPHPHQYPPPQYRSWNSPYAQYPMPPIAQYPSAPVIVSSYLPSQPVPPPPPPSQPAPTSHVSQRRFSSSSSFSQTFQSPTNSTNSLNASNPQVSIPAVRAQSPPPVRTAPFIPPLPWYSTPNDPFPPRAPRRRRRRRAPDQSALSLELPAARRHQGHVQDDDTASSSASAAPLPSATETPLTSRPSSEADSTNPTTPSSAIPQPSTSAPPAHTKSASRQIFPAIPLTPIVPHGPKTSLDVSRERASSSATQPRSPDGSTRVPGELNTGAQPTIDENSQSTVQASKPVPPTVKAPPKSWADLVRSKASKTTPNGLPTSANGNLETNGVSDSKAGSLADALNSFKIETRDDEEKKISFLEPRGLVNTGNMCYMNSVLQILVFCVPFNKFLDQLAKRAVFSFKNETPLLDAMIMFLREFTVIDSATSAEQLRMRIKEGELEQYGEPFIPEFVYDAIRRNPRFATMRRGHQQDAEEFLGFLLDGLHEECVHIMKASGASRSTSGTSTPANGLVSPSQSTSGNMAGNGEEGWLEVGRKQKPSVTRSSGMILTESPVTKIFGGKLRSELRVQGLKNSVTLEPYQPLQLDIQSPAVHNITDALKGLTRSETLHGDFNSPRGPAATAIKQVFIETLPPVLILHLKRFTYDNAGGTQKIWKKVGYPLELEIPKEAFPPHKRGGIAISGGLPKYRLIGVVYHHGKNASGGHYTVDVRRQDGREWVRLDDTVIRRVKSEDVAAGGSEEDARVLAAALEQQKRDNMDEVASPDQDERGAGWKQVNGSGPRNGLTEAGKTVWSGLANGKSSSANGKSTPREPFSVKDNKVAYLLFYEKI